MDIAILFGAFVLLLMIGVIASAMSFLIHI